MTKQKEIKEGIRGIIKKYANELHYDPDFDEIADLVYAYLRSKGCVIKVETGNDSPTLMPLVAVELLIGGE